MQIYLTKSKIIERSQIARKLGMLSMLPDSIYIPNLIQYVNSILHYQPQIYKVTNISIT